MNKEYQAIFTKHRALQSFHVYILFLVKWPKCGLLSLYTKLCVIANKSKLSLLTL